MPTTPGDIEHEARIAAAFARADQSCSFGPSFFLGHLGRFVRDHCPTPAEHLPAVEIRLAEGQSLDLCHIIAVSPRWAMLAVRDHASHQPDMAIEMVPFEMVQGVRIRSRHRQGNAAGFAQVHAPAVISAEALAQDVLAQSALADHGI